MKHITATIEVDMGLYHDTEAVDKDRLLQVLSQGGRSLMVETVCQLVIKDIDTGLTTSIIGLEDA